MKIETRSLQDILVGKEIVLISTDDPDTNMTPGNKGTIRLIDDTGTIFADWENGSKLGLIPDVDRFAIIFN
jgi:hypothetical protein